MRAELPGPSFGKLESRISKSIHILYAIYIGLILAVIILLRIGKVDWFEAILLAFGTASTGGFDIVPPQSIAAYDSQFVHMVIAVAMMIFGMSFNLIYLLVIGKFKQFFKSEELRWYLGIIISAVLLISASVFPLYTNIKTMFQDVFFTTTSIITSTAYTTVDIQQWPIFAHIVLLFLMFCGGMSGGSTASGLKVARIMMFGKSIKQELRRMISPPNARYPSSLKVNLLMPSTNAARPFISSPTWLFSGLAGPDKHRHPGLHQFVQRGHCHAQ